MSDTRTAKRIVAGSSEVSLSRQTIRDHQIVTLVPDGVLTTLYTYTALVDINIVRITAGGDNYAKFHLLVNGSDIEVRRSAPDRYVNFDWSMPLALDAGETIQIKVKHFFVGDLLDFEATLYGFPDP